VLVNQHIRRRHLELHPELLDRVVRAAEAGHAAVNLKVPADDDPARPSHQHPH
jgi:hypothetical protein